MKKFIAGLTAGLVLALIAFSVINYQSKKPAAPVLTPAPVQEETAAEAADTAEKDAASLRLDYDAMKAAFPEDEVVADINGKEITWGVFRDWIAYYARTIEDNMQAYAMYGMTLGWNDQMGDNGETYASFAAKQAGNFLQQIYAVSNYTEENNIVAADLEQQLNERKAQDRAALGENISDEEFEAALEEQKMTLAHYEQILTFNILYNEIFKTSFGENGELVADADAVAYLKDNGYYSANHILFLTGDPMSEEEFDAERVEAAKEKAEETAAELMAIEDHDELIARFLELKQELDEDSGKVAYPNGYTFLLADMVPEFSGAVEAAQDYEVTGPVQSAYGYHVIIRLPLDPDAVITGQQTSARQLLAGEQFSKLLEDMITATNVQLKPVLDGFTLADFLK